MDGLYVSRDWERGGWGAYSLMSWEWEVSVFIGQWPMVGKMWCVCV